MNTNFKFGLFAGVATILYLLIFYWINPRLMLSWGVLWSSLLIYLAFMALAVRRLQAISAEHPPFRLALRAAFLVFVVANAVYYLFYFVLFKYVDPHLLVLQQEMMVETTQRFSGLLGVENAEEVSRQFEQNDLQITLANSLFSYAWSLLGGFLLALAVAGALNYRR